MQEYNPSTDFEDILGVEVQVVVGQAVNFLAVEETARCIVHKVLRERAVVD